jgi:formylmethanofuran dehydrogenase subunit E
MAYRLTIEQFKLAEWENQEHLRNEGLSVFPVEPGLFCDHCTEMITQDPVVVVRDTLVICEPCYFKDYVDVEEMEDDNYYNS